MSISCLSQKESVYYDGPFNLLLHNLKQLSSDISIETPETNENENKTKENENKTPTHILKMFKVFFKILIDLNIRAK